MTGTVTFIDPDKPTDNRPRRRYSGWRQRLIDAERGISFGFRTGSSLFGHIFFSVTIGLTAVMLRVSFWEGVALAVAMICGFAAELFHLSVKSLAEVIDQKPAERAVKLSAAGMVMLMLAAGLVIALILGGRIARLLE